jgi:hypothetical protein
MTGVMISRLLSGDNRRGARIRDCVPVIATL